MRSTISRCIVVLTICLFSLRQAGAQGASPPGFRAEQNIADEMDPHAAAILQQIDETYKAMRSFSVELDEGTMSKQGNVSFSRHAQLAFLRPDHLALATQTTSERRLGPSKVMTDGKNVYHMLAQLPNSYTEFAGLPDGNTPFSIMERYAYYKGTSWLYLLLDGSGIESNPLYWKLKSLSSKQGIFVDGSPVETVTARWVSITVASQDWEIHTYTIGSRDHLLYQECIQTRGDTTIRVARFRHSHPDATLPDSLFVPPADASLLPLAHVVTVVDDSVSLDKGSLDGLVLGDILAVFVSEKIVVKNALLRILKTDAHTCIAEIVSNTSGVFPGEVCMVVDREVISKRTKPKPGKNAWLWPPEKPK